MTRIRYWFLKPEGEITLKSLQEPVSGTDTILGQVKKQADINTFDYYISSFPEEKQKILVKLRETISKSAPEAEEKTSFCLISVSPTG